jgi:hypothetical protein
MPAASPPMMTKFIKTPPGKGFYAEQNLSDLPCILMFSESKGNPLIPAIQTVAGPPERESGDLV